MKKKSRSTAKRSSRIRYEERPIAGPGATLPPHKPVLPGASTSVPNVELPPQTDPRSWTTCSPSLFQMLGFKAGTSTQSGSIATSEASKSSVSPATTQRQLEKTSSGVKYDGDKPRTDLLSPFALLETAKVLSFGARKYEARNWEKGIAYTRCIGAILRHTFAYMLGETYDKETGLSHMAHVMCEAMFILHFEHTRPEFDDRPKYTLIGGSK